MPSTFTLLPGRTARVRYTPFDIQSIQGLRGMPANHVFFVQSTSSVGADTAAAGTFEQPFLTLAYAITRCTASKGDIIVCLPGHAETVTAQAMSTAGVKVLGVGYGRNRPTFTATTGATNLVNVTAANCELENLRLVGAASGVTALLDLSSAATDFVARNVSFEMAATPLIGVTVSGAHRFQFMDCDWLGTANGPDTCISILTKAHDWQIVGCRAMFGQNGLDNEFLKSVVACQGYLIDDVRLIGLDTLIVNFTSSSSGPPDGLFASGFVMYSAAIASVEDGVAAATSKGMAFGRLFAVDAVQKAGAMIPLATAS